QIPPAWQPLTTQELAVPKNQPQANPAKRKKFVKKNQIARESKCRRLKTNDESTNANTTPNLAVIAESIQPRKRSSSMLDCSAKQTRRMAILPSEIGK